MKLPENVCVKKTHKTSTRFLASQARVSNNHFKTNYTDSFITF